MERLKCGGLNKFIVFKREDIEKYAGSIVKAAIPKAQQSITYGRQQDGKKVENEYLVINTDEPYANEIIDILKRNGHWG